MIQPTYATKNKTPHEKNKGNFNVIFGIYFFHHNLN